MLADVIAIHVELGRCQEGGGRQFVGGRWDGRCRLMGANKRLDI